MSAPRSRALILLVALHSGGAEKTCIELARCLKQTHELTVVALLDGGPAERELRAAGIPVEILGARGFAAQIRALVKLARLLRRKNPHTVITFLYLADLIGGLLTRLLRPRAAVYWNIRNNVLPRERVGLATHLASRLNARLSRWLPEAIVYCSELARTQHEAIGYRSSRHPVVQNSAATVSFRFNPQQRDSFREQFVRADFAFLFVGRFDPVKRVDLFIDAAARVVATSGVNVRFLLAGRGMESSNEWLVQKIRDTGVESRFELLGHVENQQALYSAADCLVVTSETEGSPNAVYEAIATGLPVLVFATLGTEHIIAPTLLRLPTRNFDGLLTAMLSRVSAGATPASARVVTEVETDVVHPLAAWYRNELAGAGGVS